MRQPAAHPRGLRLHPAWFAPLVVCLTVLVATVLAVSGELGYRVYSLRQLRLPPPTYTSDPDLIYALNPLSPGQEGGFRGGPPPSPGPRIGVLVVCLGGSTTHGTGLAADSAWPHVVEVVLRDRGVAARVLNAGVPGYGSRQLLVRFRRDIAKLHPEFVVLYEGWNRTGALVDPFEWVPPNISRVGDPLWRRILAPLSNHSLVVSRVLDILSWRKVRDETWQPDPFHERWVADMDSLVREVHGRGQRPVLVVYPSLYHPGMSEDDLAIYRSKGWHGQPFQPAMLDEIARKHAAIRRIVAETGALLVDVQSSFSALHGAARAAMFVDEMHASVAGHRRIGEAVASALESALAVQSR